MNRFCFGLLLVPLALQGASLNLINDSDVNLRVVIQSNAGNPIGELMVSAHGQDNWAFQEEGGITPEGLQMGMPGSLAPYQVSWYCAHGGALYGTCSDISDETSVIASGCVGAQQCGGTGA